MVFLGFHQPGGLAVDSRGSSGAKAPGNGFVALQRPGGAPEFCDPFRGRSEILVLAFRGCRFAQPRATIWQASGLRSRTARGAQQVAPAKRRSPGLWTLTQRIP